MKKSQLRKRLNEMPLGRERIGGVMVWRTDMGWSLCGGSAGWRSMEETVAVLFGLAGSEIPNQESAVQS